MQVILTDDVFQLGKRGEVVKVADGYGRNYLIPRRLAIPVTPGNLKMIEQQRLAMAKKEAKFKEEAQLLASELNQMHLIISRKAGDTGALFGSVTSKDLGDLLATQGIHIDRRKILMEQPAKSIGNYNIEVRPHSDVQAIVIVSVLPEGDEAVARAKKRDAESDRIVADLDAKVRDIALLTGTRKPEEAVAAAPAEAAPEGEAKPKRKSRKERAAEGRGRQPCRRKARRRVRKRNRSRSSQPSSSFRSDRRTSSIVDSNGSQLHSSVVNGRSGALRKKRCACGSVRFPSSPFSLCTLFFAVQ